MVYSPIFAHAEHLDYNLQYNNPKIKIKIHKKQPSNE